jgi:hypothetical protein
LAEFFFRKARTVEIRSLALSIFLAFVGVINMLCFDGTMIAR